MKTKNGFKHILIIVVLLGIVVAGCYFLFYKKDKAGNTVADNTFGWKFPSAKFPPTGTGSQLAYSSIRNPGDVPQGLPVRLKIPIIGVDSAIEDALITPDGRMDVPAGSVNVAWFALGPHPGEVGSAVIGGHFGIRNGVKFVFYDLNKLQVGDKVYIVNDKGDTLLFKVRLIKLFDRNADATTVFTSNDGLAHLNLITCEGIWNAVNGNYPQRLVVFTDQVTGEGPAPSSSFNQTLRIGTKGMNVKTLQNSLAQKGFFKIPPMVADGYFGPLTRVAVLKYQVSVGISSDGVFGQLTRAKLMPPTSPLAVSPALPITAIAPEAISTSTFQIIIQSIKSLYATPIDGLVTTLLLIAIVFVIFKIIL